MADQNKESVVQMSVVTHTHTHLWVQLAPAFIYSLLSCQSINDFSIIQFSQSLILQPLSLLSFSLKHTNVHSLTICVGGRRIIAIMANNYYAL